MKLKFTSAFFLCLFCGMINLPLHSQNFSLELKKWDGTGKSIALDNLRKITFSGTDVVFSYTAGSPENVPVSEIRKFMFSSYTGLNSTLSSDIHVFPNPSSDYITLSNLSDKNTTVELYTLSGMHVMSSVVFAGSDRIDVRRLSKGIYIIKVNNTVLKFTKI